MKFHFVDNMARMNVVLTESNTGNILWCCLPVHKPDDGKPFMFSIFLFFHNEAGDSLPYQG